MDGDRDSLLIALGLLRQGLRLIEKSDIAGPAIPRLQHAIDTLVEAYPETFKVEILPVPACLVAGIPLSEVGPVKSEQ